MKLNHTNTPVGTVLTIDNRPNEATVIETGSFGVYILTEDNWKIPFSFNELNSRQAKIVRQNNDQN